MLQLPSNYYHCFLGNGIDAVLIGPTGSMVADKICVDRCQWYKSDRYYPEDYEPCFPLHEYLSDGYQLSTAGQLRKRHRAGESKPLQQALRKAVEVFEEE